MKFIRKVETLYGPPTEVWESNDGFTIILHRYEKTGKIFIENNDGVCTRCIYTRLANLCTNFEISFGGVSPPKITFPIDNIDELMDLIESADKNNLYFDDVH